VVSYASVFCNTGYIQGHLRIATVFDVSHTVLYMYRTHQAAVEMESDAIIIESLLIYNFTNWSRSMRLCVEQSRRSPPAVSLLPILWSDEKSKSSQMLTLDCDFF
jgi:hypothetical protein